MHSPRPPRSPPAPTGRSIAVRYDVLGRKVRIDDPDAGATTFAYDGLGDLTSKTTPEGNVVSMGYDDLGRPLWSADSEGVTMFAWDTAPNGVGQLAAAMSPDPALTLHEYDPLGRPERSLLMLGDEESFAVDYDYDSMGRLSEIAYPEDPSGQRLRATYDYNDFGYPKSIHRTMFGPNNVPQTEPVWETLERDTDLALTRAKLGNGVLTTWDRDPATGLINKITASPPIQTPYDPPSFQVEYAYNDLRNVATRTWSGSVFGATPIHESFEYDELDRLTEWQASGPIAGGAGIRQYLPRTVSVAGDTTTFRYGPSHERVEKSGPDSRTVYAFGLYEKRITSTSVDHVFFVPGEAGVVAQITRTEPSPNAPLTEDIRYFTRDILGSSSVSFGHAETQVFDPWGDRIVHTGTGNALASGVMHGFTDQRHEEDLGWIDMNARMYDPSQRRFTSPDPFVSDPLFSTGRNRFAYVRNNPLRYTDPTGLSGVTMQHDTWNADKAAADPSTIVWMAPIPDTLIQGGDRGGAPRDPAKLEVIQGGRGSPSPALSPKEQVSSTEVVTHADSGGHDPDAGPTWAAMSERDVAMDYLRRVAALQEKPSLSLGPRYLVDYALYHRYYKAVESWQQQSSVEPRSRLKSSYRRGW